MKNKSEVALGIIGLVVFIAIVVGIVVMESSNCDGTLVRGLIWFECIKG